MHALGHGLRCETRRDAGGGSTSLFVPEAVAGGGLPLVLAPALGLDGRSFSRLAPLHADRPLLLWNPPNDLPLTGGVEALGDLMLDHVGRMGVEGPLVIGGSSFGGVAALAAAARAPERVAGLVLIGVSPAWRLLGWPMRSVRRLHPFLPRRGYNRRMARILVPGREATLTDDARALRLQAEHRTKDYGSAAVALFSGGGAYDLRPVLAAVRAPALVLHCERDRIAPWRCATALSVLPGAEVVSLPGGSHLPHVSDPERCLGLLRPFLARCDGELA